MIQQTRPAGVRANENEMWIEYAVKNGLEERTFDGRLCFGRNMAVDGIADLHHARAWVIDPDNHRERLEIAPGETALEMTFRPRLNGNHMLVAEYDAGIHTVPAAGGQKEPNKNFSGVGRTGHYYQYAKSIISGVGPNRVGEVIGQELEILPLGWRHCHVGDSIALKVLYDGQMLTTGTLTAVSSTDHGPGAAYAIPPHGWVTVTLDRPGHWMFKVRHVDPGKGKEGIFDEKVVTSVYTVMDVHSG